MRAFLKVLAGLAVVFALLLTGAALATQYYFQEPFMRTWSRALGPELAWQRAKYPSVDWAFAIPAAFMAENNRRSFEMVRSAQAEELVVSPIVGPRVLAEPLPVRYSQDGVPLPVLNVQSAERPVGVIESLPSAAPLQVASVPELVKAMREARPGDHILLAPGTYRVTGLEARANGTAEQPIFLRAARLGEATIQSPSTTGIDLSGAYWVVENLVLEGVCSVDDYCEHGVHVFGGARSAIIRNNVMRNFNAPIKVNLSRRTGRMPDFGLIEGNRFSNDRPRLTTKPVTLIDIVAADGWRVASNFIADFAKAGGDYTSYAAFIKGANRGGVFERNLVVCEWKHRGGVRLGLSLGGGGTTDYACRDGKCAVENDGGVIRNNVVLNCPNDVGIYLNKAANAVIHNNLLAGTMGLDARFPETDAYIFNNIIDGRVRERDGGTARLESNLISGWRAALLQPVSRSVLASPLAGDFAVADEDALMGKGRSLPSGLADYCGRAHDGAQPDIGPFSLKQGDVCSEPWLGGARRER